MYQSTIETFICWPWWEGFPNIWAIIEPDEKMKEIMEERQSHCADTHSIPYIIFMENYFQSSYLGQEPHWLEQISFVRAHSKQSEWKLSLSQLNRRAYPRIPKKLLNFWRTNDAIRLETIKHKLSEVCEWKWKGKRRKITSIDCWSCHTTSSNLIWFRQ